MQQLAKEYRETGDVAELETPSRKPDAIHPVDLADCVLAIHETYGGGAVAVTQVLRVRDDLGIATNTVHEILTVHESVTENPNKQGRWRPWVRFERVYAGATVYMVWYHNKRDQWCLAVEDDAARRVFDTIETDSTTVAASVKLLDSDREALNAPVPILEVITDHGSESISIRQEA